MEKFIKPKEVAKHLNITPKKASDHAREIEETKIHTFNRTPLGSVLFLEHEIDLIKDYDEIKMFFDRKAEAQKIFKEQMMDKKVEPEEPEWFKMLKNAKKQPIR